MPVPVGLTNNPYNTALPGDVGFDPLGIVGNTLVNNFCESVGFNNVRWYREAELMHGRVAMLATFNMVLRATPFTDVLPDKLLEQDAFWEFVQLMAMLEAFRGCRLLFNAGGLAGDLGLGKGPINLEMSREELAEKQYKELQNGRLAMLAFSCIAAECALTGHAIGMDPSDYAQLQSMLLETALFPQDDMTRSLVLTALGALMVGDGVRRLSTDKSTMNDIAAKALNFSQLGFGVQDPQVPLPARVRVAEGAQRLRLSEEQVRQYEEDGVIMIKGAMTEWVDFLRAITDFQIEHPHMWSLVGRMSGMYDYIQRNMWMTNDGFRDFIYYSPLGHVMAQLGRTEEVRCTTDMLLVNPNRGFAWHQDNQNGPITFPNAMRWWVAMDRCGQDGFGAPEYLLGSHRNSSVSDDAVFVKLEDGDLPSFGSRTTTFVAEPGDLIVWNARTIHRIVAPPDEKWDQGTSRRAIGGTCAKAGALYHDKGGASGISDLAGHSQVDGELLKSPYFPRIYPQRDSEEEAFRAEGRIIGRSPEKIAKLAATLAWNAGKYISFAKVVGKKE